MDENLRVLIRKWTADPSDKELQEHLDAQFTRIGWLPLQDVLDVKLAAQEILNHKDTDFGTTHPNQLARFRKEAEKYKTITFGLPPDSPYAFFMLSEGVFSLLPYPTFPEDATALIDSNAYDAAVRIAGCENCLQYLQGCICDAANTDYVLPQPYPFLCPNCETRAVRAPTQEGWTCKCDPCQFCNLQPCHCTYHTQFIGSGYAVTTHDDPAQCSCRGSGWIISDFDSIHRCNIHPVTAHHPECDAELPFDDCYCSH